MIPTKAVIKIRLENIQDPVPIAMLDPPSLEIPPHSFSQSLTNPNMRGEAHMSNW
jgi:hypothetical protein